MSFLEKTLAFLLFPLGLLIIIEELGFFSFNIFDKVLIGSIIMIVMQTISLFSVQKHNEHVTHMNYVTYFFLILPCSLYLLSFNINFGFTQFLPLMIGTMMFVEALYAFH
jgi:hypothetical protein